MSTTATSKKSSSAGGAAKASASASNGNANGSISETALKLKHVKGIHEDDGKEGETATSDVLPLDAQVIQLILESMGADKHEPRVVSQLQEFVHRYVTDILIDAQEYSTYADKQTLDADDIRLAIASRLNHHYASAPSRELMMELAEKRNAIPLPPISNEYGVRLPPAQHQLVTYESERHLDDTLTADDSSAYDEPMPLQQLEGTRNKKIARDQIPIHLNQRKRQRFRLSRCVEFEFASADDDWSCWSVEEPLSRKMWAFNAYETAAKPPKTFDVEDFLSTLFRPQDAFVHAASLNQLEVVRRWISKSHNINELDKEGNLALCTAAQNRCMDVMMLLLENGVDTNAQQADEKTALHIACTWGRFDAAALLLQHGASVTLRDKDGQVPLHGACKNGHERIVQLLLDANVDPFIADDCGATPIDLARDWQRLDILRNLDALHSAELTHRYHHAERGASAADAPVADIHGLTAASGSHLATYRRRARDKIHMLFVLSQKLLRWFVTERRELERLNQTLQEELLEAMRLPGDKPDVGDVIKPALPPPITCTHDADTQTEAETQERDSQYTQTEPEESERVEASAQTEVETVQESPLSQSQETQTHQEVERLETVQTETTDACHSETQATQTDTEAEGVETSVQTEDDNCSSDSQATQTEMEQSEASIQTETAPEGVDGAIQTDSLAEIVEVDTQTDAKAAGVEICVQTETWSESVECGVQVLIQAEATDCCVQTLTVECTDGETQATLELPTTTDQAVSTLDFISFADSSTETETRFTAEHEAQTENEVAVGTPPLETYFQVQRSVMMLQRIVRGFVTRRRFYRMLTELVNAK